MQCLTSNLRCSTVLNSPIQHFLASSFIIKIPFIDIYSMLKHAINLDAHLVHTLNVEVNMDKGAR